LQFVVLTSTEASTSHSSHTFDVISNLTFFLFDEIATD